MSDNEIFGRTWSLIVSDSSGKALDFSEFRITFAVKRTQSMVPNTASIRVYNLGEDQAKNVRVGQTVFLQAGYVNNLGVIFKGTIKQVIFGRESGTDTFLEINSGDGQRAYDYAIVNKTVGGGGVGVSLQDQLEAAAAPMKEKGVAIGSVSDLGSAKLPRGKVLYGMARKYVQDVAESSGNNWSIQNEKIEIVKISGQKPTGQALVLNSKTGMIGSPSQTTEGVNVKMFLNPTVQCNGFLKIDERSIQRQQLNLGATQISQLPHPLNADGIYRVYVVEHTGDNRGSDWSTSVTCLNPIFGAIVTV